MKGAGWAFAGLVRGLVLGLVYPWVVGIGFAVAQSTTARESTTIVVLVGVYGTLIGLVVGPLVGGVVALAAAIIDALTDRRLRRGLVAAIAIGVVATVATVLLVLADELSSGWGAVGVWMSLVGGPAGLGLVSIVVCPLHRSEAMHALTDIYS